MKHMKKLFATLLSALMLAALFVTPASALTTTQGKYDALYPVTDPVVDVAYKGIDVFTEALNAAAGMSDTWSSEDGKCITDISYGPRGKNVYDLYIPKGLSKNKAQGAILFIHGGAWVQGSKSNMTALARTFAKKGYITATMSYDLLPDTSSPVGKAIGGEIVAHGTGSKENANIYDILGDVKKCIASIKTETNKLGYKVDALALSGVSAGSHISLLFAYGKADKSAIPIKCAFCLTAPVGFYKDTFDNMSVEDTAQYAAMISGTGLTTAKLENPTAKQKKILDSISPVAKVTRNSVPTYFGYAGKDTTVGTNQFATIEPVLKKNHVPYDVIWFPNSDHTLLADPGVMDQYLDGATSWLAKYM